MFSNTAGYPKQHHVDSNTVIAESKHNILWKGNFLHFNSGKFWFAVSVQRMFTDQSASTVNKSEIRFQIFSNLNVFT